MPRPRLFRTEHFAYHVMSRSNNREWFYIPLHELWRLARSTIENSACKYGTEIHLFVLMSNHYHLIVSTPNRNLDEFMRHFLSTTAQKIQARTNRKNHIFGARYKGTVLESAYSFAYVYKYVARNPVRASMCRRVEDHEFSTISNPDCPYPISEGFGDYWSAIPKERDKRLDWLNTPCKSESESLIKRGLRRQSFRFTTDKTFSNQLANLRETYGVEPP